MEKEEIKKILKQAKYDEDLIERETEKIFKLHNLDPFKFSEDEKYFWEEFSSVKIDEPYIAEFTGNLNRTKKDNQRLIIQVYKKTKTTQNIANARLTSFPGIENILRLSETDQKKLLNSLRPSYLLETKRIIEKSDKLEAERLIEKIDKSINIRQKLVEDVISEESVTHSYLKNFLETIQNTDKQLEKITPEEFSERITPEIIDEIIKIYFMEQTPFLRTQGFYKHTFNFLEQHIHNLKHSPKQNEKNNSMFEILRQTEQKLLGKRNTEIKNLEKVYEYEKEQEKIVKKIMNNNLLEYYTTKKELNDTGFFTKKELDTLKNLRNSTKIKTELTTLLEKAEKTKEEIKEEIKKVEKTSENYFYEKQNEAKKDREFGSIIDIFKTNKLIEKKIKEYEDARTEKTLSIGIGILEIISNEQAFEHIKKQVDKSKLAEPTYSKKIKKHLILECVKKEVDKIKLDELIYLKTLKTLKKEISKKGKNKNLTQKITELENKIINYINKERKEEKNPKAKFKFNIANSYKDIGTKLHSPFDCLSIRGKYEKQGLALFNNSKSSIVVAKRSLPHKYLKQFILKNPENEWEVASRVFLYEATINKEKTMFVAGISGSEMLENLPLWKEITLKYLKEVAKENSYDQVSFNMQPLGDVRTPSTKYIHEFTRFVAQQAELPEEHYTYEKIGSGRKPRFFMLKQEHKEQYLEEIKIARDPDLIGDFYIEGMYPTKQESLEAKLITNPNQHEFKPTFIKDKGYAPIITFTIDTSREGNK